MSIPTLFYSLSLLAFSSVQAATSYPNDFVNPDYILAHDFPDTTNAAQNTIISWAREYGAEGPWTVMNKSVTPPSGDKHDYMSWAPYYWPDCSNVGNTTELAPEEIWLQCEYNQRDGQFNPDGRLINDVGAFDELSNAVLYNSIAHVIAGQPSSDFSKNTALFLKTWFLDEETRMNPNLNYAQMQRGPSGQIGKHTGVLDLKGFAKIASGIIILRKGGSPDWTTDLDSQLVAWCREYITWLETAEIALQEGNHPNNHGTFYYNQLASLKIIVDDRQGTIDVTDTYFNEKQFLTQIEANGEQPLEAARTRPFHYHAYNAAAMITNARIAAYASGTSEVWNRTSSAGATIQTAVDYAMTLSASDTGEDKYASELYPYVAAVGATYGDPDGKYANYLKERDSQYFKEPYFLWDQPLAGGESDNTQVSIDSGTPTNSGTNSGTSSDSGDGENTAGSVKSSMGWILNVVLVASVVLA